MAAGVRTDVQIFNTEFHTGLMEGIADNFLAWDEASNGTIRMLDDRINGNYYKAAFIKRVSGATRRRDPNVITAVTPTKLEEGVSSGPLIKGALGPIENTLDSLNEMGFNITAEGIQGTSEVAAREMSRELGSYLASEMMNDQLTDILTVGRGALMNQSANFIDFTARTNKNITFPYLLEMKGLLGDKQSRVRCYVMHGDMLTDLGITQTGVLIEAAAGMMFLSGTLETGGVPILITDNAALKVAHSTSGEGDDYVVLGLVDDALRVINTPYQIMLAQYKLGGNSLTLAMQGEYDYVVWARGFSWDESTGGALPTRTALGTAGNLDKSATSFKDLAGVAGIFKKKSYS